jgi:hypothetical protein
MVRAWKSRAMPVLEGEQVVTLWPLLTDFIMSTVLLHFGVLDELIQVIYQGADRFVALSQITESAWSVYLGLKGPEGRWWRGSWSAQHIIKITVRVREI